MYKITLLPGDGIGPEVTNAAKSVLRNVGEKFNVTFSFNEMLFGGCSIDEHGIPITDALVAECYSSDAVLLGAVGGPKWESMPHHLKPEAGLLKLRSSLGLFCNLRPAKVYSALLRESSLKSEVVNGTDMMIVRELTGGIYFGEPRGAEDGKAWNTMVYSENEIRRIAEYAFKIAKARNHRVTSVDKANVLEVSQFWREIVHDVHKNYPDVELSDMYVDNAAMQIVRNPRQFDVIVTSNLFGDILSDTASMITGSLGMLPSASLGNDYALYEPVHGSAPDIAGKNVANPVAAIASAAMMLKYSFQMDKASDLIIKAIENVLNGGLRTADIALGGKSVSTNELTSAIIEEFDKLFTEEALYVFSL